MMEKSINDIICTRTDGDVVKHLEHAIKQAGRYLIENASVLAHDGEIGMQKGFQITLSVNGDDNFVTIKKESEFYLVDMEGK